MGASGGLAARIECCCQTHGSGKPGVIRNRGGFATQRAVPHTFASETNDCEQITGLQVSGLPLSHSAEVDAAESIPVPRVNPYSFDIQDRNSTVSRAS